MGITADWPRHEIMTCLQDLLHAACTHQGCDVPGLLIKDCEACSYDRLILTRGLFLWPREYPGRTWRHAIARMHVPPL